MYITVQCAYCESDVVKNVHHIKTTKKSYCDKNCHAKDKTTTIAVSCGNCSVKVMRTKSQMRRSKSGKVFCNRSCATIYNNTNCKSNSSHPSWKGGARSYRARALKYCGTVCSSKTCPFDYVDERMLDVHHIDGNRSNNRLSNLRVLCVWCHAIETRLSW